MHDSEWRVKVLEEVQQIPDAKLAQLYEMIHGFRLSSETNSHNAAVIMQFAGCWSDMSDEAYGEFSDNQRHFGRVEALELQDWSQT